ncbi:S-layer homology domain-containing protein [Paenibacillus sp. N3.4]|uniref:CBM96 family carbohydrate-binding protein n=1 Tax=Paenibacillus sp. N3.4 TaxID=2603222 RepID=UPI0011CAC9F8|nr:S-layer homology domain-containing protein [Paenibacillus sp. N3.4]TXK80639.1 DNRLRE domain-containing protein [Paenibacillus sp. N3.4]
MKIRMFKAQISGLLCIMLFLQVMIVVPSLQAASPDIVITGNNATVEDTFIDSSNPTVVNGTKNLLSIISNTSRDNYAYFKFNVNGINADPNSQYVLKIGAKQGSSNTAVTLSVYGTPYTSWGESDLTWGNATSKDLTNAAQAKYIGQFTVTTPNSATIGGTYSVDVTDFAKSQMKNGNSWLSFIVADTSKSNISVNLYPKEASGSNPKPTLLITAAPADSVPPTWPSDSKLTAANINTNSVDLSWTTATDNVGVTNYRLYKDGILDATVTGTTYKLTGLMANTTYQFRVEAGDAAGLYSMNGPTTSVTTLPLADTTPPTWPNGSSVSASSVGRDFINLSWTTATDASGVAGYKVYKDGMLAATVNGTSYNLTGLDANTTYQIKVEAYDTANNHTTNGPILSAKTEPIPPYVPKESIVTSTDMVESFDLFAVPFNYGTGSASKQFNWRANAANGPWWMGTDVTTGSTVVHLKNESTSNTGMWNENFNKDAVTGKGNMLYSAKVKILDYNANGMIGIGLRIRDANTNYVLAIKNGKLAIIKKINGGNDSELASAPIPDFSTNVYYTLTFLTNGNTLIGSINDGPTLMVTDNSILDTDADSRLIGFRSSAKMVAYIDDVRATQTFPTAPTNLAKQTAFDGKVVIHWGSVSNEQGYAVKRGLAAGGPYKTIATVNDTTYVDTVTNGITYYYVVSPLTNAADGVLLDSTLSNEISALPQPFNVPPVAPSGVYQLVGDQRVSLHWNAGNDVSEYVIKRAQQPNGAYTTLANLPLNVSSYEDTGLTNGSTYYYVISAVNSKGSIDSEIMTVTPSVPTDAPSGVTAVPANAQVKLAWNPVSGAESYMIFRSTSQRGPFQRVAQSVRGTDYIDTGITNGTNYYYVIRALNTAGASSAASQVVAVTPKAKYIDKSTVVTASSNDGNAPSFANDNSLSTRWGVMGIGQWIQYDLGVESSIGYMAMSFYKGDSRSTKFNVSVSNNGTSWTTIYSGESSGTTTEMEPVDTPDVQARYIKITGKGNSNNDYFGLNEVQVYPPNPNGLLVDAVPNTPSVSMPAKPVKAGLYNEDGTPHPVIQPNSVTGRTINVTNFSVGSVHYAADILNNGTDDRAAIQAAIDSAQAGDEVYFPNGVYNLKSAHPNSSSANLVLKSGVNLRGESQDGVILLSDFDNRGGAAHTATSTLSNSSSRVLQGLNVNNIRISNLTISSTWDWIYPTDPYEVSYDKKGGPKNGIYIDENVTNPPSPPHHIWIDHVTIEKFEKTGIRLSRANNTVIENSSFRQATDIGPGGAGYGIALQGIFKEDTYGKPNDTQYNVIRNNSFDGTDAMRHGVIVQAYAHNNAIYGNHISNTTFDSIDLHGEFEYLNEVYDNTIIGTRDGAGVGLGNTGGGFPSNHSATGPFNYVHNNLIQNTKQGILIYMGTPDTTIENNTLEWTAAGNESTVTNGLDVMNAPRTVIRGNTIKGYTASASRGINLMHDPGDKNAGFIGMGDPQDVVIEGNTITGNTYGVVVDIGTGTVISSSNTIEGNLHGNVIIDPSVKVYNSMIVATEDTNVLMSAPSSSFGNAKMMGLKTNKSGTASEIAYFKFHVDAPASVSAASFQLSGRLTDPNPGADSYTLDLYGIDNNGWSESDATWLSSPNHSPQGDLTGKGATATYVGSFSISGNAINSYNIATDALTQFVASRTDGIVSLMVVDSKKQDANIELYTKEKEFSSLRPVLKLVQQPTVLSNANLGCLVVKSGTASLDLTPAFAKETTEYSLTVIPQVSSLVIQASPESQKAKITVNQSVDVGGTDVAVSLSYGSNLITVEVKAEDGSEKKYQINIIRNREDTTSGTASSSPNNEGNKNTPSNQVPVEIKTIDGQQIAKANVDEKIIDQAAKNAINGKLKLIADTQTNVAQTSVVLNNGALQKFSKDEQLKSLIVDTKAGSYELPKQQINLQDWASKLGTTSDKVNVEIVITPNNIVTEKAKSAGQDVLGAVDFTVKATSADGKSVEIVTFTQYVPRTIKTKSSDKAGHMAAVRVETDKSGNLVYQPIPFKVSGNEVTMYSRTNSTYMLVSRNVTFNDIRTHWAKDAIESMANKVIVEGTAKDQFQPDQAVTRAEFAALIARTIGLKPVTSSTNPFRDLSSGDWFEGQVYAAANAGIVTGYNDQTFRPNQQITRQEMAVMIFRAMKAAGYNESNTAGQSAVFSDENLFGDWAKEAISIMANLKIVEGIAPGKYDAAGTATRAQSTVVLSRMLQNLTFTK